MRTIAPLVGVVCIGLAAMVVSMSGIAGVIGAQSSQPSVTSDARLNDTVPENASRVEGTGQSKTDGEFVAFVLGGLNLFTDFAALVALLPLELRRLGLPWYWAYPLGVGAQFLTAVGMAQLAMNRRWK